MERHLHQAGRADPLQDPKITPLVLRGADVTPISLHVTSFEEAADQLEKKGYSVKRKGRNSGTLTDPWGNMIDLHDHRKS